MKFFQILTFFSTFFNLFIVASEHPLIDFDDDISDFILEEKQIVIPGYPNAFNPSIMRWENEKLLLCFRYRDSLTKVANIIGFVWLNEDFEPVGTPTLLTINGGPSLNPSKAQGPRLIKIGNIHWMVYNNIYTDSQPETRRMILAHLHYAKGRFFINDPRCFFTFSGDPKNKIEKNWSPFDHKGYAHFSYTLDPHRVFRLSKNDNKLSTVGLTGGNINWSESFGEIHGGTPSLKDGDSYFGFFHSWKDLKSIQSKGEKISHFFMGAYLFNEKPPFELTHISDKPIIGKTFFHGPDYETWKPIKAIYPGGFVFNKKHVWVVYGRQDHECWVVKMDKKALIQSLISVN